MNLPHSSALDDLPKSAIVFLRQARVGRLATASADRRPHVVPVCYAFDGEAIVIALDDKPKRVAPRDLRRSRNILANPRASLVVDQYSENWSHLLWVLVEGAARITDFGADHARAVELLRAKYPQYRESGLEAQPVIRVEIDHAACWGNFQTENRHLVHVT